MIKWLHEEDKTNQNTSYDGDLPRYIFDAKGL